MLLARVAESMYWMGRYVERAECTARILIEHCNLHVDLPRGYEVGWEPLLHLTGTNELYDNQGEEGDEAPAMTEEAVLRFLISDPANAGAITVALGHARENLRTTRSVVPREAWEILNGLYVHAVERADEGIDRRSRFRYLRGIVRDSQTLAGLLAGTMNHDEAYAFLSLGRLLERADMTTRVLDVRAESLAPEVKGGYRPFDNVQWMGVLKSVGAYQMYRRSVGPQVRASSAVRFLLQDQQFPRSVTHCLDQMSRFLKGLPHPQAALDATADALLLVHEAPLPTVAVRSATHANVVLHDLVDRVQIALGQVSDEIDATYFRLPVAAGTLSASA
jgi:uncharacterized alpha-E superfamily protein